MASLDVLARLGVSSRSLLATVKDPGRWRVISVVGALVAVLHVVDVGWGVIPRVAWLEFVLAVVVMLVGGEFLSRGFRGLRRRRVDPDSLLAVAAAGAFLYSSVTTLLVGWGRLGSAHSLVGDGQAPQLFFASAGAIVLSVLVRDRLLGLLQSVLPGGLTGTSATGKSAISGATARRLQSWLRGAVLIGGGGVATLLVWSRGGVDGAFFALVLGLLVVGSPRCVELAAAVAQGVGSARATARGFHIEGPALLDRLGRVDVVVFNELETLTVGCPQVTDVIPIQPGIAPDEVLYLASALIYKTDHPIREAILLRSSENCRTIPYVTGYELVSGRGIRAMFQSQELVLGNLSYLMDRGVRSDDAEDRVRRLASQGKNVLLLGKGDRMVGLIAVADDVRGESRGAVERIRQLGIRTELFSGDHEATGDVIRRELGLDGVHGEMTRADALEQLDRLARGGHRVAMVAGRRVDAATLARADVRILLGSDGTESAGGGEIRIAGNDLCQVPDVLRIARHARRWFRLQLFGLVTCQALLATLLVAPLLPGIGTGAVLAGPHAGHWLSALAVVWTFVPVAVVGSGWCALRSRSGSRQET